LEAGIAWDLSSNVFEGNVEILGGTFMGSLVEHATSSSLWEEEKSGWVTTICPGSATNFVWGSSGGKNWLQFEARTARARARARSQGIASRIPMGGRDRSRNPRWAEGEKMAYLKEMLNSEYLWEQETDHVQYILEPYSALRGQLFFHQNIFPISFGEVRRNTLMLSRHNS
jgi:hypothetical protein